MRCIGLDQSGCQLHLYFKFLAIVECLTVDYIKSSDLYARL